MFRPTLAALALALALAGTTPAWGLTTDPVAPVVEEATTSPAPEPVSSVPPSEDEGTTIPPDALPDESSSAAPSGAPEPQPAEVPTPGPSVAQERSPLTAGIGRDWFPLKPGTCWAYISNDPKQRPFAKISGRGTYFSQSCALMELGGMPGKLILSDRGGEVAAIGGLNGKKAARLPQPIKILPATLKVGTAWLMEGMEGAAEFRVMSFFVHGARDFCIVRMKIFENNSEALLILERSVGLVELRPVNTLFDRSFIKVVNFSNHTKYYGEGEFDEYLKPFQN